MTTVSARTENPKPGPKPPHPAAQRTSAARKEGEEKAVQQCSRRGMRAASYRARAPAAVRTSAPAVFSSQFREGEADERALVSMVKDCTSSHVSAPPSLPPLLATYSTTESKHLLDWSMNLEPYEGKQCARALSAWTSDGPAILISDCAPCALAGVSCATFGLQHGCGAESCLGARAHAVRTHDHNLAILLSGCREGEEMLAVLMDCTATHLSSPAVLPLHLATRAGTSGARHLRHLEGCVDLVRHRRQQERFARALPVTTSGYPAFSIRDLRCRESKERAVALDCTSSNLLSPPLPRPPHNRPGRARHQERNLDAARKSLSSSSRASSPVSPPSPLSPLTLKHTASIAYSLSPPSLLLRSLCTSPSDEPVILSDTRDKSNPAATALPRTTTYSPSWSSARTASSRAVEATFCKNRRKTRGRGRRAIAPLIFCFSRTLVLAVPLLVLATLASVRRPGASWSCLLYTSPSPRD